MLQELCLESHAQGVELLVLLSHSLSELHELCLESHAQGVELLVLLRAATLSHEGDGGSSGGGWYAAEDGWCWGAFCWYWDTNGW